MELSKVITLDNNGKIKYLRENNTKLDENTKIEILKSIDDINMQIDCIEDNEIGISLKEKLRFNLYLSNNDNSKEIDMKLEQNYQNILKMLNESEIIDCLEDETLEINSYIKKDLIKNLESDDLKLGYLTNQSLELEGYYKAEIIASLKDSNLKLNCLMNSDIELDSSDKEYIISSIEDDQLKWNCLTNPNIEIDPFDKAKIVLSIKDPNMKLDCLTNPSIKLDFSFGKDTTTLLKDIILSLPEDVKFSYLINPIIELEPFDNGKVIASLKNEEQKISLLKNPNIKLNSLNKAMVICTLSDDEKKLELMKDFDMHLNEEDKILIVCSLQDENKFKKFGLALEDSYKKSLNLPTNMKVGVELEAEGTYAEAIKVNKEILKGWAIKGDGSLEKGVEIVSPILHSTEDDMYTLATVCNVMQKLNLYTNEDCGGHIHFDADFLGKDYKAWENFFTIYYECEEIFYKMTNKKGQIPRKDVVQNAKTSNDTISEMFKDGNISIKSQEDLENFIEKMQDTRYRGVNLCNIKEGGIQTIEFRMPNGTIDIDTLRENIYLFGQLLNISKQMSLNPEYKNKEFSTLKRHDLTEKEKVESLLNLLCDDKQDKNIYRQRWESVKSHHSFEQLKAETPTFKRGKYSMRKQVAEIYGETKAIDRINFVQIVKTTINRLKDRSMQR